MILNIETPDDFSFVETLNAHGWRRLAPFECADDVTALTRAEQFVEGDAALLTIRADGRHLVVDVVGNAEAPDVVDRVRVMFQLDLPIDRFHQYCAASGELAHIPVKRQGRMLCSPTLWEDCCKVILTTNTTWGQTVSMTKRLVDSYGRPARANPEKKAFPTPERIAAEPFGDFEATARFGYRNLSIHALAVSIVSGELELEQFRSAELSSAQLWKRLQSLRGIGPYAASCLMIYLGRYDRVNVDSWARMMVSKELGRQVSDREVHEFFAPHGEWSGLVYHFFPWRSEEPAY